jgi:hypothetical protein
MRTKLIVLLGSIFMLQMQQLAAQELQAKVSIVAPKITNTDTKRILKTLETQLGNFLNNRKWTTDVFTTNEKISCNFIITINSEEVNADNIYEAKLIVQAARPVYNTAFTSALINHQDPDFKFRYVEYQPIEFNENRVQGTEIYAANLTATLAYYVYIILGIDYSSFSPRGGDVYFQKAWNVVSNAPGGVSSGNSDIKGWRVSDGLRSRYWLAENFTNTRYGQIHDALYFYYRNGLDKYYEDENMGRTEVLNALNALYALNTNNPNLMFIQFFFSTRNRELGSIFKKSAGDEKNRALEILQKLDIPNANYYKNELK